MLLEDRIAAVDTMGREILAALANDDLAACEKLIAERAQLLAELATARDTASPSELDPCRGAMDELIRQDAALQQSFAATREQIGGECEELLGRRSNSGHPSPYQQADPTCLDRKA